MNSHNSTKERTGMTLLHKLLKHNFAPGEPQVQSGRTTLLTSNTSVTSAFSQGPKLNGTSSSLVVTPPYLPSLSVKVEWQQRFLGHI